MALLDLRCVTLKNPELYYDSKAKLIQRLLSKLTIHSSKKDSDTVAIEVERIMIEIVEVLQFS